ncbi:hypothetical protein P691DRAFT_785862 [Macrolepiota fuliginosa MF-IS2]|uniref:Uncharacterized protein n=1 Tax=Macrolepiota fuliginosa MF-IS2 TaxID=1400762 RepID=A0A9P5X788_9AGAR|nr:hypothetical protein P691DRAFT_785862 [Macrolepiota fuliginosa MF-IS2]
MSQYGMRNHVWNRYGQDLGCILPTDKETRRLDGVAWHKHPYAGICGNMLVDTPCAIEVDLSLLENERPRLLGAEVRVSTKVWAPNRLPLGLHKAIAKMETLYIRLDPGLFATAFRSFKLPRTLYHPNPYALYILPPAASTNGSIKSWYRTIPTRSSGC